MRMSGYARMGALLLAGAVAAPALLSAQTANAVAITAEPAPAVTRQASPNARAATAPSLAAQPRGVAVGRYVAPADSTTPPLPVPSDSERGNTALMLAGAATIIVGSVVGGDGGTLLIVGGAVIGMFGLFRYLMH